MGGNCPHHPSHIWKIAVDQGRCSVRGEGTVSSLLSPLLCVTKSHMFLRSRNKEGPGQLRTLKVEQSSPGKGRPIPNGQSWRHTCSISNIIQTEQVILRNMYVCTYTYMYKKQLIIKRIKLEREWGRVHGCVWRKDREGWNYIIIYNLKYRRNAQREGTWGWGWGVRSVSKANVHCVRMRTWVPSQQPCKKLSMIIYSRNPNPGEME